MVGNKVLGFTTSSGKRTWAKWKARAAKYAKRGVLLGGVLIICTLLVAGILAIAHIFPPVLIPLLGAIPAALGALGSMYDRAYELCEARKGDVAALASPAITEILGKLESDVENLGDAMQDAVDYMERDRLKEEVEKVDQSFGRIANKANQVAKVPDESFVAKNQPLSTLETPKSVQQAIDKNVGMAAAIVKDLPDTKEMESMRHQVEDVVNSMKERTKLQA